MIDFDGLVLTGESPIYMQIIGHVKRGIVSGAVAAGDELPSRRVLSALLGVNPNTVQKAFALLEEEGLVSTRPGAKSLVTLHSGAVERIRAELLRQSVRAMADSMKQMGVSRREAQDLIERYWEGE